MRQLCKVSLHGMTEDIEAGMDETQPAIHSHNKEGL
jgi:hypothetical protein